MVKRYGTLAAALAAAATLAWAAPAAADTPGFAVRVTQAPETFTVGKDARTVSATASTTSDRLRRCVRVRWALIISTRGVSLDQIRINRVENGQSVPVRAQLQEDSVRVVDAQVDPGQLCRGQSVVGKWTVAFTGPDNGQVTFSARALSQQGRLLAAGTATSQVVTAVAAKPSKTASPATSPFSAEPTEAAIAPVARASYTTPAAAVQASEGPSLLGPGLLIGAILVFLGVGLLLWLRARNRRKPPGWQQETQMLPTGFYNLPRE